MISFQPQEHNQKKEEETAAALETIPFSVEGVTKRETC